MSKPILTLPCKYNIGDFGQRNGAHHCNACDHNLVDFRNATDEEIAAALKAAGSKTCGIFRNDQTVARTSVFQLGLQRRVGLSLLGILGFISPVVLTSCDSAQDTEQQQNAFSKLRFPMQLKGTLTDKRTNKPISNAEISILQNDKTLLTGKTDDKGRFHIEVKEGDLSDSHFDLVLARLGYTNDTLHAVDSWNNNKQQHMQLTLQAVPKESSVCTPGKTELKAGFIEPVPVLGKAVEPYPTTQGEVMLPEPENE